jgi:hypothetical protein
MLDHLVERLLERVALIRIVFAKYDYHASELIEPLEYFGEARTDLSGPVIIDSRKRAEKFSRPGIQTTCV